MDKYMPQEYRNRGKISKKYDVYSLGTVMIEIMEGYSLYQETDDDTQFKQEVLSMWSCMIGVTLEYQSEQLRQLETCIDIAISCIDSKRKNRPTVASILEALNKTETGIPITQLAVVSPTNCSLVETLKKMTTELDNITNSVAEQVPGIKDASSNVEEPFIIEENEDRETSSYVEEGLIIGRTEEKKKILSILSKSSMKQVVILPIYGIGGIGKTTLAQLLFNGKQFNGYSRVWIYVSEQLNLYKIGNSIISQLSKEISNIANMQIIHNRLEELFSDKRILIVLDDLWEDKPHKLDNLKAMLRLGKGSKVIIVTTRDEAIATKVCSTVENVTYKLQILSNDMCWDIIKQKSNFENQLDKEQLEKIGKDIAIKCGGVALAAQSIGYMLRDMTPDQWESVRNNHIWNSSSSEDPSVTTHEVLTSLPLSYSHMHKFLKLCFSYCAVFPKGHIIAKYDLIHQWIALEFTTSSGIFNSMQLCEGYFRQLLGMSFLQCSIGPWGGERHEKGAKFFTMHDLVHDLATSILADKVYKNGSAVGSICQYALLTDPSKPLQSFMSFPKKLRALHYLDCGKIELHDGAISAAECLVVLDLSGCHIQKIPDSIGQLMQLRYLHAPRIQDNMIPNCITKLSKLNYLNLRGSRYIEALPYSIGNMKDLMHLDLSGCVSILELPVSFAGLKKLVHLDLSHCSVDFRQGQSISGFTTLRYVNLSTIIETAVKHIKRLSEVIGNLSKLRYLNLSNYMQFMAVPEADIHNLLASISTLCNLEHLDLSRNRNLSSVPESICNLTKLRTPDLSDCNVAKLPAWIAKMVSLNILNGKFDSDDDDVNTSTHEIIVEASVRSEKMFRHLVPDVYAASTSSQDTRSGSRINNNGTAEDADHPRRRSQR